MAERLRYINVDADAEVSEFVFHVMGHISGVEIIDNKNNDRVAVVDHGHCLDKAELMYRFSAYMLQTGRYKN